MTQIADSITTARDTVSSALSEGGKINSIHFDPSKIFGDGMIISILGYIIVFAALLLLYLFLVNMKTILHFNLRKRLRSIGHKSAEQKDLSIPGEITAVISTAIYLHFAEIHDEENTIITIKKVQRPYSPWSSKLHGMRQNPRNY